jgi:ubiquinone/menaquinone biosynthesis C-methylase UbiE
MPVSNKELSGFLKEKNSVKGVINYLKIVYRPYICPFNVLLGYIPKGSSVLDIGCGQGQFAMLIAEYCKPSKLKGIDIKGQFIKEAIQLFSELSYPNVSFELYDGVNLPDDLRAYEFVTMIDVFHHIPKADQLRFISKLYESMGTGSTLIIKEIDRSSPLVYANKLHDIIIAGVAGHEISRNNMKMVLKENGFRITDEGTRLSFWYPHYWFITRK